MGVTINKKSTTTEPRLFLQPCGLFAFLYVAFLYIMFSCVFATFPYGALGQMWYLIVLIPDLCLLPYLTLSDLLIHLSIIILYSFVYVFLHSLCALPVYLCLSLQCNHIFSHLLYWEWHIHLDIIFINMQMRWFTNLTTGRMTSI